MSSETSSLIATITTSTFTVATIHRRVGLLRECVEAALFHESGEDFMSVLTSCVEEKGSQSDATAIMAWGEDVLRTFTRANIATTMTAVHTAIEALPVFTLYIPVMFPEEDIADIGMWCRAECGATVLLDIHIDPNVVGGCSFVWNDTFHDFSFRSRMKTQPGVVTNALSEYA